LKGTKTFSILFLYPETYACKYGESYYTFVEDDNMTDAIEAAEAKCYRDNPDLINHEQPILVLVTKGRHADYSTKIERTL